LPTYPQTALPYQHLQHIDLELASQHLTTCLIWEVVAEAMAQH
jgi:hypothetical protein